MWLGAKRETRIAIFVLLCCIYPEVIVLALIGAALIRK